jgi:hypothetical protein
LCVNPESRESNHGQGRGNNELIPQIHTLASRRCGHLRHLLSPVEAALYMKCILLKALHAIGLNLSMPQDSLTSTEIERLGASARRRGSVDVGLSIGDK